MDNTIIDIYTGIFNNFKNQVEHDVAFKNTLLKEHAIETLDPKWKSLRENIQRYLEFVKNQHPEIENKLLYNGYFIYEDVAAIFLDLFWQYIHNKLNIRETILHYKVYKIQICNRNLLTYNSN